MKKDCEICIWYDGKHCTNEKCGFEKVSLPKGYSDLF